MGQQVGGALGGRQEASFECVLGKVSRLQRGRKQAPDKGGLLSLCLGAPGSAVAQNFHGPQPCQGCPLFSSSPW